MNVRFAPQISLSSGYQGFQQFDSSGNGQPWAPSNDEIYITHFEATVDDGSGTGPQVVRWSSESKTDDGSLYWDSSGGTNVYKFAGTGVLSPDSKSYNFTASVSAWDFSSKDNTVGVTPSRTISVIFDAGIASRPCNILNVKIRFVVTAGVGSNIDRKSVV